MKKQALKNTILGLLLANITGLIVFYSMYVFGTRVMSIEGLQDYVMYALAIVLTFFAIKSYKQVKRVLSVEA